MVPAALATPFARPVFAAALAFGLLAAVLAPAAPARAAEPAADEPSPCRARSALAALGGELRRTGTRLRTGQSLKIVAIGSSSTAGAGASASARSYPSRLAAELASMFPAQRIEVVNRGINGEQARDMLSRFDRDVLGEQPDLVVWQVGTNALFHPLDFDAYTAVLERGIERLKKRGIDVVLMDPQYAPRVLATADYARMVAVMDEFGRSREVPVFHRFALMQQWAASLKASYGKLVSPDGLHMNDTSYGCLAYQLASAIASNAVAAVAGAPATPIALQPANGAAPAPAPATEFASARH